MCSNGRLHPIKKLALVIYLGKAMEEYHINEKDIGSVIRYLSIHDPKNADRATMPFSFLKLCKS